MDADRIADRFDALLDSPRRRVGAVWLPLAIVALLVLLIAGLLAALVLEDRQLRRDALLRDTDSAAQQLGSRIGALAEALGTAALEAGSGANAERRLAALARDLKLAKPEVLGIERVAAAEVPTAGKPYVVELPGAAPLLAVVAPVLNDGRQEGALVARVAPTELLRNTFAPETTDRYRLALVAGERVLGSTSASVGGAGAHTHAAPVPMLPPSVQLQASAFRTAAPLARGAPLLALALGIAAALALGGLAWVTARQARIDRALAAEAGLRRALEESQATGLQVIDAQGTIRYVNRAFSQMTGLAEAGLIGQTPPYSYWPADQVAALRATLARVLEGTLPAAGVETTVQRRDGTRFAARLYASPLLDDADTQMGWVISLADITETQRIRNALAAAHDRFTAVLESLQTAVSVMAPLPAGGEELVFANRAYRERFGADGTGHARLLAALRAPVANGGEVFDAISGCWFDLRSRPLRWVDAREARLQVATDITARKTAEDAFRQQQEKMQFTARLTTLGEMASTLAHELNQPLTAIANYCEALAARARSGELTAASALPALEKTSAQALRAGRVVRRIREFVKRSAPHRRATAAAQVIDNAVALAEIEAQRVGIAIDVRIEPGLPPLDIDPLLIEQVLLNLLKNAMDAMAQARVRRIEVAARRTGDDLAEIAVTDHGSGIAPEVLPQLFEPFYSTKPEGMGMGLNICRSIVEYHRGQLTVTANPAGGTTMRFTLPLFEARARQLSPTLPEQTP
ncbi:MAG: ATP-binding protein [Betaproteobacteria bacterium]